MATGDLESSWELLDKLDNAVVAVGECSEEWQVERKELYTTFCAHKEEKSINLGKMALNVANFSKPYPILQMRLYPCGVEDDRDNHYVTLGVEFHQHSGRFKDTRVKLSATVEELPGRSELGSAQVIAEVNEPKFNVLGLVSHMVIMNSQSSHFMVHVTAVIEHMDPGPLPVTPALGPLGGSQPEPEITGTVISPSTDQPRPEVAVVNPKPLTDKQASTDPIPISLDKTNSVSGHMSRSTYCHAVVRMSGKARVYILFVQRSHTSCRDDVTVKV